MKKILLSIWENMKKAGFTLMFLWSFLLFLFVITLDQTTWWLIALFGILVLVSAYMMVNENTDKDMTNIFGTYKRLNKISKDINDLKKALVKVVEKDSNDINGLLKLIKYSIEQNEKAFRLIDEKISDTTVLEEKLEILNKLKEDFTEANSQQEKSREENVQRLENNTANALEILQDSIGNLENELAEIKGMLEDLSSGSIAISSSPKSHSKDNADEYSEFNEDIDFSENEVADKDSFSQENVFPIDNTPDTVAGIDMGSYMANLSVPTDIDYEDGPRTSLKDEVEDVDLSNFDFGAFLENNSSEINAVEAESTFDATEPAAEPVVEQAFEPVAEPEVSLDDKLNATGVDLSDPNANLSPDDIAKLFAASNSEPAIEPEVSLDDKLNATGVDLSNPNANLSPDDIAKLFAASGN
ncbi:MAG: hypothetical protein MJ113_00100 [Lachnospiraceae bacterium]|nr:hypothetical protein [Lachnospiraceae bacterium]